MEQRNKEYSGSDKENVLILVRLLIEKGIKRVVISPGSRNAPLIISLARRPELQHFVILDERSAAFFALGMAQRSGEPVVLVCTSGTALLNYAPAIAEAWYQRIPLLVLSADRPMEWIDQDDCQTIRQEGVFEKIVKFSCQLPAEIHDEEERWYTNRLINDALNYARQGRPGPVHINVPLREPLYGRSSYFGKEERTIACIYSAPFLQKKEMVRLKAMAEAMPRVMILAGFTAPDSRLREAMVRLSKYKNIVVFTETLSNLPIERGISTIDRVLTTIGEEERVAYAPDLLISFGGSLISKHVKTFLRKYKPSVHWSIDLSEHPADTFQALTHVIRMDPADFFPVFSENLHPIDSDYAWRWSQKKEKAIRRHTCFVQAAPWSDLKAFSLILPALPAGCCLQLANSTPVRYAQLFEYIQVKRVDGNRGTSGIDGSISTAVGAACIGEELNVLICGDMSFLYDSNALWNKYITPRLKIIVMKNGGGGIFRFLPGSSEVEELEECFETAQEVNIQGFAELHHFCYFQAMTEGELQKVLPVFWAESRQPAILAIETPHLQNAVILKNYFRYLATGRTDCNK